MAETIEKVNLKDFRETFYKCRNFELSHLWQRSIFLTAFLLLCFTGYGHVVIKIISTCSPNMSLILYELASGIALIGIIFSIIWIMMAKASKAWYEVYEKAICKIENEPELGVSEMFDEYKMGKLVKLEIEETDANIFTNNPGQYSPSKLNIFIGKILLFIWGLIFIIHMVILAIHIFPINLPRFINHYLAFSVLVFFFFLVLLTALTNNWARSSAMRRQFYGTSVSKKILEVPTLTRGMPEGEGSPN
ncbi:hypothetical protein AGMMS49940_19510 [Spirochaetia bacterium]|nr:hypothetical protein AGMMS49940_19510 [Spirochaetia bacterium]